MLRFDSYEMESLANERARLSAMLEIAEEKKTKLEIEIDELNGILNVIDKTIDSVEVEYE